MIYLKKFLNHTDYESYITGGAVLPNVSLCETENEVHFNPVETRVVAKFNVTSTTQPTKIISITGNTSSIEIDGAEQPSVTTGYTFDTTGEHTVKYTLIDNTIISDNNFGGCSNLVGITLPNSILSIGSGAFNSCGLNSVTIPNNITSIGYNAFRGNNLQYVEIRSSASIYPDTFKSNTTYELVIDNPDLILTNSAFISDNISDLRINNIGQITADCFRGNVHLSSVTISNNITDLGVHTFRLCSSLSSITIPDNITSIGNYTFCNCSNLSIPALDGITSIGDYAFHLCNFGSTLDIPESVTNIGSYAFSGFRGDIIVRSTTPPQVNGSSFFVASMLPSKYIYVPSESLELYSNNTNWQQAVCGRTFAAIQS